MTCGHCQKAVERAINELPGIKDLEVFIKTSEAKVTFDETQISREQIVQAVNSTEVYKVL